MSPNLTVKLTAHRQQPGYLAKLQRYGMRRYAQAWANKKRDSASKYFAAVVRAERLERLIHG